MKLYRITINQRKHLLKLKSQKGLALFTFISIFFIYKSHTNESKEKPSVFVYG